ncbi:MAG: DUF5018 domain-containing protein [Treponema sp.]|jgi:hypothetical protein|nr:DUF5018 domain-containing protein [Treponema sp.]
MKVSCKRWYGVFTAFLFAGSVLGCDLFYNSMVDYLLDSTGPVEVTEVGGGPKFVVMTDGTVLIPPSDDEPVTTLAIALSNPRNLLVRQELAGVPEGKNSSIRQAGAGEIAVRLDGAEEGDEYELTLALQSPDGLRDFPAYSLRILCVSFETALRDFSVDGVTPPAFNPTKDAFQANLPHTAETVTLGATTVHAEAVVELSAGADDSGAALARGAHAIGTTQNLELGYNYFYATITAPSSAVQGYAITLYRAAASDKAITALSFALDGKHYGVDNESGGISGTDITVTLPHGTDLSALKATVSHTGISISPDPAAVTDYTAPVAYRVTAANGSSATYTVTVKEAPGITISGISVSDFNALTFKGVPASPVPGPVTVTIAIVESGVTVNDWFIEITRGQTETRVSSNTFTLSNPGSYSVNVIATVDGIDYSGSFGLMVK